MNKVILTGRITKSPELRRTNSGKAVVSFTLAVDNRRTEAGADFPVCVAWEKTAETIEKYVTKGMKIAVCGRLSTRTYESNGKKHYVTEVLVEEFEFLEKKEKAAPEEKFESIDENDPNLPF